MNNHGVSILERAIATSIMIQLQMSVALTVPIKDPTYDVMLGVVMYGNYNLPEKYNSSQNIRTEPFEVTRRKRRAQRDVFYRAVEMLLESSGGIKYGRACVLRSICEAASSPVQHDGLIGELLHVLLTPSSTSENGLLHSDYTAAEGLGRHHADCGAVFPACPSTPLDLISTLQVQPP